MSDQEQKLTDPRILVKYRDEVKGELKTKFNLVSVMSVPKLTKICLNMGVGRAATDNNPKLLEQCVQNMTTISGQKAVMTIAKQSISNFKLREGMNIGCRVTLRGVRMYEFFDRFVNIAVPRIRDFRGLSPKSFDGRGNYSMGIQEQTVFPEIEADRVEAIVGMDVTICTSAPNDEQAFELLKILGMPFKSDASKSA